MALKAVKALWTRYPDLEYYFLPNDYLDEMKEWKSKVVANSILLETDLVEVATNLALLEIGFVEVAASSAPKPLSPEKPPTES